MNRRVPLTLLALAVVLGMASLGRWQLGREQEKRAQLAAAEAALAAPARPLSEALVSPPADTAATAPRIDRVAGTGRFTESPRLLLDNQRRGERVGVRLYCVFAPEVGPELLVDLGWLPMGANRAMPDAPCPRGPHAVSGLLVPPPSVGLRLGPGLVQEGEGTWLATRVEPDAIAQAWQRGTPLSPRVLRLDPALPLGFERDLALLANTLPPEKHRGYAVQWFGLAIATLVITLVLNLRRRP